MLSSRPTRPLPHNGGQTYPQSPRLGLLREYPPRVRYVAAAGPTGIRQLWVSRNLQPRSDTENHVVKNTVASEIRAMDFDDSDMIIGDRMHAEGQSLVICGPGGVGKSTIALQLAVARFLAENLLNLLRTDRPGAGFYSSSAFSKQPSWSISRLSVPMNDSLQALS